MVEFQNKALLTEQHLEQLFPHIHHQSSTKSEISALSTFMIDNSELLAKFKEAFRTDMEWRNDLSKPGNLFSFLENLVFHDNHLFIPQTLRPEILYSCHDAVLTGHPG